MGHGVEKGRPGLFLLVAALPGEGFGLIIAFVFVDPQAHIGIDIQQYIDSGGYRPCRIKAMDKVRQFPADLRAPLGCSFGYFVAVGIQNDAGVISCRFHHGGNILLPIL